MTRSPRPVVAALAVAVAVLALAAACADIAAPTTQLAAAGPARDLVITELDVTISAEEFDVADVSKALGICVKGTPSGNVLMMDANEQTPSQPCPPAWQYIGKPQGIKIHKEWFTDDKNGNGQVCVKFVGTDKTIVKDDNMNTPSQPCPPSYNVVGGKKSGGPNVDGDGLAAADEDHDGLVCVNAVGDNFIVRDDNNATPSQPCPPAWYVIGKGGTGEEAPPAEGGKD